MDQNHQLAVAQMRESIQTLGSSSEGFGEETMMRFLIARSMDIEKAAKMFVQWQKWRAAFVPLNHIPASEIPDELAAEKIYLQPGFTAKGNHPFVLCRFCKHFPNKDLLQFQKFVVYVLDKTIASSFRGQEIGNEKLVALLDLQQISYKNIDLRGLIAGFQFLQAYYPERLARLYILNMPSFFVGVWRLVSRFLEKATSEKVVIVSNEEERKEFVRDIGDEVLPQEYGGNAKLVLIQDLDIVTQ